MAKMDNHNRNGLDDVSFDDQDYFAMPADMEDISRYGYQSMVPASEAPQVEVIFDDDPSWKESIGSLPVRRARQPVQPPRQQPVRPPRKRKGGAGRKEDKPWKAYLYVGIITVCFVCMCVMAVMMMPQMAGYFWKDFGNYAFVNGELLRYDARTVNSYKHYRDYLAQDVIYPGVFIDGVHVGGMTIAQAREALTNVGSDHAGSFSVTVAIGDKTWTVDSSNVPAARNLGNVLEQAYAIGRGNSTEIQITQQTPFKQRVDSVNHLQQNHVNLRTTATYDKQAVWAIVNDISAYVTRDPIDAQILSFDYKTRSFTFTQDQPGVTIDSQLLFDRICAELDKWEKGVTVTVDPIITKAAVTTETLSKGFTLISAYTTKTTSDSNRNTNIRLACEAINGTALMPGETFSFNQATGQRTTAKGYRSAGAIAAGQSIEEVGGGICQVSSTLFNAVARADLQIVERSPHARPSSYVGKGEDATVNWPNLDFKFKNNTDAPIFIITYYKDRQMSAEIWGMTLGEGVTIDLESKVIRTIEPSAETNYVLNPELPFGTSEVTVKARTGYVVETYKVWYKDGQEIKRELLHKSTYKAYQQVVEYN